MSVYPDPPEKYDGWWVISDHHFLTAMKRAVAGEDPELLYVEYAANTYNGEESQS